MTNGLCRKAWNFQEAPNSSLSPHMLGVINVFPEPNHVGPGRGLIAGSRQGVMLVVIMLLLFISGFRKWHIPTLER